MQKLAEICIKRPVFASMLILALVVVGAASHQRLAVDRLPSVDLPTITVRTTLPGAAPEEVETEVSQIVEEAVNTVDGIDELRSISGNGSSIVMATFRLDRDIDAAAQDVRDRVAGVLRQLPDDVDPPIVSKFDNDSTPVLTFSLAGDRSLRELTELADKIIKPQLERSKGVGEVLIVGGVDRTVQVRVSADRLASYNIPITAVRDAIALQNADVPGGNITGPEREQVLRTLGRLADPASFNDIVIATVNGAPIRIRDVGRAEDAQREQRSSGRLNGQPAVSLEIRRQSGANSTEVIEGIKAVLPPVIAQLPPGVRLETIRDQSNYIYAAMHEINLHLVLGAVLASLVVLLFMRSWRSTIIAALAIPTSLIATFAVMYFLHFTLNSVTMLALVLMVGIVIDDAIVVLENIYRNIEEKGLPPMQAAREGTREIGLAVLATTLSLVVIFVPVSFMSSISGRFLYQFGITAAAAVMVSLLVSFTLTPALSARMLKPPKEGVDGHTKTVARSRRGFYRWIDAVYTFMLKGVMRWRYITAIVAVLIMLSAIPLYRMIPQDYLPSNVDEDEFTVNVSAPEGTSFLAMDAVSREIEGKIARHPAVRIVQASVGGSYLGQVNNANIYVRIAGHEERYFSFKRLWKAALAGRPLDAWRNNYTQAEVMNELRRQLRYADLRISIRNFPAFNIPGGPFDVDLAIRGPDLQKLAEYTETLRLKAKDLGIPDADTTLKLNTPELRVTIDRERAADLGVTARDIGTALRLLVGGDEEVSRFRDPATNEDYLVQLRLDEADRRDTQTLPRLLVTGRDGRNVELRNLASLGTAMAAARIDRLDRQRAADTRGTVGPGYALADRLAAMRGAATELNMPPAYTVRILGRGRELERTFVEFLWAFALSLVFMYMILASNYESIIHPFTIMLAIPLSVPFAFISLLLTGGTLNLYSALGILVLFGVVKKNAILQIDHMNQLRAGGPDHPPMPRAEAIIQGCRDRLRPILMTTLSLVGGLLPIALGSGPGAEERRAIANVVIGGQTLALLLTLLLTPVAYSILDDAWLWIRRRRKVEAPVTRSAQVAAAK